MAPGQPHDAIAVTSVALACLVGCQNTIIPPYQEPKPTYQEFHESCGSEGMNAWLGLDGVIGEISEDCSELIGRVIGLDWYSFDSEPHAFEIGGNTTVELVVAGAFVAFATEQPTVGEQLDADPPTDLGDELRLLADRYQVSDSDQVGRLWFAMQSEWVDDVVYSAGLSTLMAIGNGSLKVGDLATSDPNEIEHNSPVFAAGALFHEASHRFLHGHIDCIMGGHSCDIDVEGADGAEAWWRYNWLRQANAVLDQHACERELEALHTCCSGILTDLSDFEPCARQDEVCPPLNGASVPRQARSI